MSMSKSSKMLQFINYRLRVTIQDGRQLVGKFMAFDRHMNLVLGDCEEFRMLPPAKENRDIEESDDRRTVGLVLLRGEEIISMTVEGPPPQEESRAKASDAAAMAGPGIGRGAGRGISAAPLAQAQPGLFGPVRGVGGPAPGMMQPQISCPPMNYPSAPVLRPPRPDSWIWSASDGSGTPPSVPPPPQFAGRPGGPPQFPGPPLPMQFAQRPMGPPGQMMRGPPPPPLPGMQGGPPPRPGMPPPPGGVPVPVYGPPGGMPPPPNAQNQQQQ